MTVYRVQCRMADSLIPAGTAKGEVRTVKVNASSEEEAKQKAVAFYTKRKYKNVKPYFVEKVSGVADSLLEDCDKLAARMDELNKRADACFADAALTDLVERDVRKDLEAMGIPRPAIDYAISRPAFDLLKMEDLHGVSPGKGKKIKEVIKKYKAMHGMTGSINKTQTQAERANAFLKQKWVRR